LNVIVDGAVLNPLLKLIVVPGEEIVYSALEIVLVLSPLEVAIAVIVVVVLTVKGDEYTFVVPAPGLGIEPSTV
jgi:hypothetical protein